MYNHVMIDIETMSSQPGGAIVTLGAVAFNLNLVEDPEADTHRLPVDRVFYRRISHGSNRELGLVFDADTLEWWTRQPKGAQYEALHNKDRQDIMRVLIDFSCWYTNHKTDRAWSHGATFDLVLMNEAYKRLDVEPPWRFYHHRDTRTLFDLAGIRYKGTAHHALQDAYHQVCAVQRAYHKLKEARYGAQSTSQGGANCERAR